MTKYHHSMSTVRGRYMRQLNVRNYAKAVDVADIAVKDQVGRCTAIPSLRFSHSLHRMFSTNWAF